jgi:hypothetical protein
MKNKNQEVTYTKEQQKQIDERTKYIIRLGHAIAGIKNCKCTLCKIYGAQQ